MEELLALTRQRCRTGALRNSRSQTWLRKDGKLFFRVLLFDSIVYCIVSYTVLPSLLPAPYRHPTGTRPAPDRIDTISFYRRPTGALPAPYRRPTGALPAPYRHPTGALPAPYRRPTGTLPAPDRRPTGIGIRSKYPFPLELFAQKIEPKRLKFNLLLLHDL